MPNTTCDLHMHTYYSDGRTSPAELLHQAAEIGLRTVAITDHDNMNSLQEAGHVAESLGLELIPGIEFTSHWRSCHDPAQRKTADLYVDFDVDVLGYYIDPEEPAFRRFVSQAFQDLQARIIECCERLTTSGYPLTLADAQEENPRFPGTRQVVTALVKKGFATHWNAALPLFLQHWRQVRLSSHSTEEVIAAIRQAGGVAVLAHPVAIDCLSDGGGLLSASRLEELVAAGLGGLEVYHPRHDGPARKHFAALAHQFDLVITGGSDEHGWPHGFPRLGSQLITYDMVRALQARARNGKIAEGSKSGLSGSNRGENEQIG